MGAEAAERAAGDWLRDMAGLVGDVAFARRFSAHFARYPLPAELFAHRRVAVPGGEILAGIRFYGGEAEQPFVEIIAWPEPFAAQHVLPRVADAWAAFAPPRARLLLAAEAVLPGAELDQSVHAARVAAMPAPLGGLALAPTQNLSQVCALLAEAYAAVARENPALRAEILPADRDDLAACLEAGTLDLLVAEGRPVGVFATVPGRVACLSGDVVVEVAVAPWARGLGFGAEAQRLWAARARAARPDARLVGTIHRLNRASRRSAERAGRPAVMAYRFLPL